MLGWWFCIMLIDRQLGSDSKKSRFFEWVLGGGGMDIRKFRRIKIN